MAEWDYVTVQVYFDEVEHVVCKTPKPVRQLAKFAV